MKTDLFTSHKFFPLDNLRWESLETSSFHFSNPNQLNDPADCQIDLLKAYQLSRAQLLKNCSYAMDNSLMSFLCDAQEVAKTCGIFSLCSGEIVGHEERLLWAHYAKNHTGICLTFEIPYQFVNDQLVGCAPVRYSHTELFSSLMRLQSMRHPKFESDVKPLLTALLTTKAPEWKYEKESRLISMEPGLRMFDRSWLKQICFGLRTSQDDKARIKELLVDYPNASLVETFQKTDDLFGLDLRVVT